MFHEWPFWRFCFFLDYPEYLLWIVPSIKVNTNLELITRKLADTYFFSYTEVGEHAEKYFKTMVFYISHTTAFIRTAD